MKSKFGEKHMRKALQERNEEHNEWKTQAKMPFISDLKSIQSDNYISTVFLISVSHSALLGQGTCPPDPRPTCASF